MKRIALAAILFLAMASSVWALPIKTAEYGTVTPRDPADRGWECYLVYYNFCSSWVYSWSFGQPGAKVGVCFGMDDAGSCCLNCEDLSYGFWGFRRYSVYGFADFEIYCVDEHCCPVGSPISGAYAVPITSLWTQVNYDIHLPDHCPGARDFLSMVTITHPDDNAPYSDADNLNWDRGCGTTWTCVPHSYVYLAYDTDDSVWVDYCAETGYPAHMFYADARSYCQTQFGIGFYHNWLADFYMFCRGPSTNAESATWSQVKALYK